MKLPQVKPAILFGGAAILLGTAGASALLANESVPAAEPDPIVQQVENHEGRITNLEGRQDTTETQVQQNTTDIQSVKQQGSTSATGGSGSTTTPQTGGGTTPDPTPAPAPTPTPAPTNPRMIISVSEFIEAGFRNCHYRLFDPAQDSTLGAVIQSVDKPCLEVGDILPTEL